MFCLFFLNWKILVLFHRHHEKKMVHVFLNLPVGHTLKFIYDFIVSREEIHIGISSLLDMICSWVSIEIYLGIIETYLGIHRNSVSVQKLLFHQVSLSSWTWLQLLNSFTWEIWLICLDILISVQPNILLSCWCPAQTMIIMRESDLFKATTSLVIITNYFIIPNLEKILL